MKEKTTRLPYSVQLPNGYYVNIDQSVVYDKRIMMESNNGESTPVEKFIEYNYETLPIKAPKIKTENKKEALNNLICNLIAADSKGKLLALSRRPATYSICSKYGIKYFTFRYIVKSADALIEGRYARQWNGYYDKNKKRGRVTRMWGTQILWNELNKYSQAIITLGLYNEEPCEIIYLYGKKLSRRRFDNPIILKDKEKNIINYKMNQATARMKNFLEKYNSFIDLNKIIIPQSIIVSKTSNTIDNNYQTITNPSREYIISGSLPLLVNSRDKFNNYMELDCWLYRVFNNCRFDEGGRFYGAEYQALNGIERTQILINDNKTVEVDYQAYHLRMLYNKEGIDYRGDPYLAVSNTNNLRTPIKKMVQMIINAKTPYEAIMAFEKYLNEEPEVKNILYQEGLTGRELLMMICNTHKRIDKYFNTGIGVKLQFIDSQIAERILNHFTKKKIVCLCIHDSFIVEKEYLNELIDVMKNEYKREMGFEGEVKIMS